MKKHYLWIPVIGVPLTIYETIKSGLLLSVEPWEFICSMVWQAVCSAAALALIISQIHLS